MAGSREDSPLSGFVLMTQSGPDNPVYIFAWIRGLETGYHGFHIHEIGDTGNGCVAAGSHYNPFASTHGSPDDDVRHVGDLGNILTGEGDTVTVVELEDDVISLFGEKTNILGRTLVIHEGN